MDAHAGSRFNRRMTPRFAVATEELAGGTPVVSVKGEVDVATAPALEQTLRGVAEDGRGDVIVDLSGCSFLDSRGLRALVTASARRERSNRPLAVVLANAHVLKVFEITGFEDLFEIYPTLNAAVNGNRNGNGNGNG